MSKCLRTNCQTDGACFLLRHKDHLSFCKFQINFTVTLTPITFTFSHYSALRINANLITFLLFEDKILPALSEKQQWTCFYLKIRKESDFINSTTYKRKTNH